MTIIRTLGFAIAVSGAFCLGWLYAIIAIINENAYKSLSTERSMRRLVKRLWQMMKAQWGIFNYRLNLRFPKETE